jgi:hypothetical protein
LDIRVTTKIKRQNMCHLSDRRQKKISVFT